MKLVKVVLGETIEYDTTAMYLDYVNNFVSLKAFADHYGISQDFASAIIRAERILNQAKYDFKEELEYGNSN